MSAPQKRSTPTPSSEHDEAAKWRHLRRAYHVAHVAEVAYKLYELFQSWWG